MSNDIDINEYEDKILGQSGQCIITTSIMSLRMLKTSNVYSD